MSRELQTIPSDADFQQLSKDLLAAFKFKESRKPGFSSVLDIARKAHLFAERVDGGKTFYLVGFSKDNRQAQLCQAFVEENRVNCSFDYVLFVNGRLVTKKPAFRNMLTCFSEASVMKDPTRHCCETYDSPMQHFAGEGSYTFKLDDEGEALPEDVSWKLPCKMIAGFFSVSSSEIQKPKPAMLAAAEQRLVTACPFFNVDNFEAKAKPKKVSKSKRYW